MNALGSTRGGGGYVHGVGIPESEALCLQVSLRSSFLKTIMDVLQMPTIHSDAHHTFRYPPYIQIPTIHSDAHHNILFICQLSTRYPPYIQMPITHSLYPPYIYMPTIHSDIHHPLETHHTFRYPPYIQIRTLLFQ